jgi:hypothetical protein
MICRCLRSGAFALVLCLPIAARAQASFLVMGGVAAPVGRLGDFTDIGYNLGAGVNIGAPALPVGVRLEGAYNNFGWKGNNRSTSIISGTANAIFNIGPQRDAPYLIAGLGIYNRNSDGFVSSATTVGINGGGGLRFPLTGFSTFFEARYHIMLGSNNDAANFQFIPITFGLIF